MAAAAARERPTPLHAGLPDEIFIWEILLRLPPKALLRCRAVCRGWRRATSSRDFLLAHHGRQPSLPLLYDRTNNDDGGVFLDIMPLDHRAGVAAAAQLQPIARFASSHSFVRVEASCDGLVIVGTVAANSVSSGDRHLSVCNPATRQYAPLPLLTGFTLAGMYRHPPTGEYRLLLYPDDLYEPPPGAGYDCYLYALGSREKPRHIGWPEAAEVIHTLDPVLFRDNMHWPIEEGEPESESGMIMVFDTTTEVFRFMRAPAVPGVAELFEMDEMMGMASFNDEVTTVDIWTTKDYDAEVWAFRYQVGLPVAELTTRFGFDKYSNLVVSSWGDDVLLLVQSGEWLLQIGIDGKLVATFHRKLLGITSFRLKQTLVPHTFFPMLEGYVVNTWPFISPDDSVVNT
uniref:Uncharacterized protein n=1 Tax=Avena sativa TaxID=4498 RepID=A0ACD5WKI8_AVESA